MTDLIATLETNTEINAELCENAEIQTEIGEVVFAGVSSWNGQIGAVSYTAPVSSVNGQTGDVVIAAADSYTKNETDTLLATKANVADIPTVPTDVSAFNNDAGYLTQHQSLAGYATEAWVGQQGYLTSAPVSSVNGQTGAVTVSVPTKTSQLNNDSNFITAAGAPVQSVNGQTGAVTLTIPTVPTNVSSFNNDAGYLTLSTLPIYQGGVS